MSKISQVEQGLSLAVQIEGMAADTYTIAERMAYYRVPGVSVTVINNGEIECAKGYGSTQAGEDAAVTPDTLFQAASISKPVSAMAALSLVFQGKLALDQDVNEVLSAWKVPENEYTQEQKVTLRRLLSHSAGLTVHGFPGYAEGDEIPSVVQVLEGQPPANTPPVLVDVTPGTLWRYSGGGTTAAQLLMTEVSGLPYADFMHKTVLEPIGMSQSTYQQPLPSNRQSQAALAHQADGMPYPGRWHTYPEQAAAGLWTTPSDLSRYVIEIQKSFAGKSNKIVSKQMIQEMLSVQIKNWGLGPSLGGSGQSAWFSHGGSNAGYRCEMIGFVHSGQGAVVMTNGDNGSALASEVIRAIASAYGWTEFLPKVKTLIDVPSQTLARYAGRYQVAEHPEVVLQITNEDEQLMMTADGILVNKNQLYPQTETSFFERENDLTLEFVLLEENWKCMVQLGDFVLETNRI